MHMHGYMHIAGCRLQVAGRVQVRLLGSMLTRAKRPVNEASCACCLSDCLLCSLCLRLLLSTFYGICFFSLAILESWTPGLLSLRGMRDPHSRLPKQAAGFPSLESTRQRRPDHPRPLPPPPRSPFLISERWPVDREQWPAGRGQSDSDSYRGCPPLLQITSPHLACLLARPCRGDRGEASQQPRCHDGYLPRPG